MPGNQTPSALRLSDRRGETPSPQPIKATDQQIDALGYELTELTAEDMRIFHEIHTWTKRGSLLA